MTEAQGIEFVISGDASEASRTLRDFATQAKSANRAAGNLSGFRRLAGSLSQITKANVGGFTAKLEKLMSSLGRIAFYRAVRSAIKAVGQVFNEGLQNAYAFSAGLSDVVDGRIAVALDGITGHALTMKNQLGAAFGSLLTAIAPIINTLIGLITSLATAITQLFAAFTGGTFLKAKDVGGQFADTMERGGGAAKEWKNQLMGFDEINRLEEPSGGGGGGGSLKPAISDMYEIAEVGGIFADIAQKWRELVDSLDFGPLLSAWDRLKETVGSFVSIVMSGLAWAWDNILVPLAHWTIESGLPSVVNALSSAFEFLGAALKFLQPYAQKIWNDFLQPIAKWTGEKFISAMTKIKDLFEGLTDLLNGDTTFSEFLDSLDGLKLALLVLGGTFLIAKVGAGLFNNAIGLLHSPTLKFFAAVILVAAAFDSFKSALDKWMETGELSADVFADMLEGIGFLAIAIGGITAPWLLVVGIVAVGVAEIIKHWDELMDWWHNTKLYAKIEELKTLFSGTKESISSDGKNIEQSFSDIASKVTLFVGSMIFALGVFTNPWIALVGLIGIGAAAIISHFDEIKQDLADMWNAIVDTFRQIGSEIKQDLIDMGVAISSAFTALWSNILSGIIRFVNIGIGWLNQLLGPINSIITFFGGSSIFIPQIGGSNGFKGGGGRSGGGFGHNGYATGGFPEDGLFMANHGELVGQFTNGRTAVINNEQIIEGIKRATYEAFIEAFLQTGGNSGNDKEVKIYIDGRQIAQSTTKYQTQMARANG